MFKALIIDDEKRDQELLNGLLRKYCADSIEVSGFASSVEEAYQLITEQQPDVLFLDIVLGAASAFDLLKKFSTFPFAVIFVTGHEEYAVTAIKFNALDYVLKPVEVGELVAAVAKLTKKQAALTDQELRNLLNTLANPDQKTNRIAIPMATGYEMVPVGDILYCEASKEYTYIHCHNRSAICSSVNLGEYETLLMPYNFFRVHHSFVVNKEAVSQYLHGEGGKLLLTDNTSIEVSRRKKQGVLQWLKNPGAC